MYERDILRKLKIIGILNPRGIAVNFFSTSTKIDLDNRICVTHGSSEFQLKIFMHHKDNQRKLKIIGIFQVCEA